MENLLSNAQQLVEILRAVHGVAILIVNLTPTPKDNEVVAKYYRVIEVLAGIITRLAKK
jgi:hypothetical protein